MGEKAKCRDNKRYVVCPVCGALISKSSDGTECQQACHRCGWTIEYNLKKGDDNSFILTVKAQSKETVKKQQ